MKLNLHTAKRKAGMTLLEISVVILVLLTLIAVLFVGAQAYKRSADRSACILNIRNAQQALRTIQNTHQLTTGATLPVDIHNTTNTGYMRTPTCPAGGTYTTATTVTAFGTGPTDTGCLALRCSLTAAPDLHQPQDVSGW